MQVIMMACGVVLLLTCAAFFIYEYITYRNITKQELSTIGQIIATNSTSSLAFGDEGDADEILSSLKAQPHIVAACLYNKDGSILAVYPNTLSRKDFPVAPPKDTGYTFEGSFLEGFQPVR